MYYVECSRHLGVVPGTLLYVLFRLLWIVTHSRSNCRFSILDSVHWMYYASRVNSAFSNARAVVQWLAFGTTSQEA